MSANTPDVQDCTDLEDRDVRALTECMTALGDQGKAAGARGVYEVVSESGSSYLVDTQTNTCDCPDHRHNGAHCKHLRRVEFARGDRDVPAWIDDSAIDSNFGEFVDEIAADGGSTTPEGYADGCDDPDLCAGVSGDELPCFACYSEGQYE